MTKIIPRTVDYNLFANYFFIGFAFSIPISNALTSLFSVLIILSWILERNFSEKINIILKDKLSLSFLFLIFFSLISLVWSSDVQYAIKFIASKYWEYLIIPIMLTSFKKEYTSYVLNAFLLSMFISEIISYGIYFQWWTYNNVLPSDPSPFMNHIEYSTYLSFTVIIIITKLLIEKRKNWHFIYSLYFLTALTNLFINGGRTGQASFLITIVIISIIYFKLSIKKIFALVFSILTFLILMYNFNPNFNSRITQIQTDIYKMQTNNDYSGSITARFALWTTGINVFMDSPILGTGIGGEMKKRDYYSEKLNFGNLETYSDYHNTFIMYAVQLGVTGLAIVIFIFYILFTLKLRNRNHQMLLIAFSTIFLLHSMGGFSFHLFNSLSFLVLFATLFNSLSSLEYRENNVLK
ncbi:MAG: O-antigen ligase family protein [Campylobacterota bacterium]|nr:O-antigen ligase family protein [Campylobacterota bacterium]